MRYSPAVNRCVEATRRDVEIWGKHLVVHGLLAFHDVEIWRGVTELYKHFVRANRFWQEVCQVRNLRVLRRLE